MLFYEIRVSFSLFLKNTARGLALVDERWLALLVVRFTTARGLATPNIFFLPTALTILVSTTRSTYCTVYARWLRSGGTEPIYRGERKYCRNADIINDMTKKPK